MTDLNALSNAVSEVKFVGEPQAIALLMKNYAEAQAEIRPPTKNTAGQMGLQKYKYAPMVELIEASKPILAKRGISVLQFPCDTNPPREDALTLVLVIMGHGAYISSAFTFSTVKLESKDDGKKDPNHAAMDLFKVFGAELTYMSRYQYNLVLGLAADDDADSNAQPANHSPMPSKKVTTKEPAPPKRNISEDKASDINALCKSLDISIQKLDAVLKDQYHTSRAEITDFIADELIDHLANQAQEAGLVVTLKTRKAEVTP